MKIYQVEAYVKIKTTVWIDDVLGQTVADIPNVLRDELVEGESDYDIVGKPSIDDKTLVLIDELTNEELEERIMSL